MGCFALACYSAVVAGGLRPRSGRRHCRRARIIRVDADEIPNGTLLVEKGKIVAVGPAAEVTIPTGANKIDVAGRVIMPGLVDTHIWCAAALGARARRCGSGPIQPGVRIYDSLNVHDPGFKRAVAGGLTTLNIMPGSGHLISGQTVYVKLRLANPKPKNIDTSLSSVRGGPGRADSKWPTAPTRSTTRRSPSTRGKERFSWSACEQYIKAREYQEKIARAAGDPSKLPPRDLNLKPLGREPIRANAWCIGIELDAAETAGIVDAQRAPTVEAQPKAIPPG